MTCGGFYLRAEIVNVRLLCSVVSMPKHCTAGSANCSLNIERTASSVYIGLSYGRKRESK